MRLTETAPPISACDQPNSLPSGTISTPGTERNPAAIIEHDERDRGDDAGVVERAAAGATADMPA